MRKVIGTGIQIERGGLHYYRLRIFCHVAGQVHPAWEEVYENLMWTEVVDVLLEELDARRPGWELDEGRRVQQPTLFDGRSATGATDASA